jgi:lincosamide and streptogramin A transport system ATP-binding/permease protein
MSIISVNNLTYYYDGCDEAVYENVSFTLDTTWKTGLIGRNGRGKTTLLKLLTGELENGGAVNTKAEFLYFPFDVEDKNMSGSELVGIICPEVQEWEVIRELSYMGTDCDILYRPFSTLSGGEQTRLLLCLLFLRDNAFLLIDEPTNCLDLDAREAIGDYLKAKSGFILVSHDRDLLDKCTDHILSLNRSDTEIINGNYSVWKENFDRKEANKLMRDKKLKSEIGHLKAAAERSKKWADTAEGRKIGIDPSKTEKSPDRRAVEGAKAKAMMKRMKAVESRRQTAIDEKSELLKNREYIDTLKIPSIKAKSATVLSVQNLVPYYCDYCDNDNGNALCKPVSFTLSDGERLCLSGKNGCGKSTILKIIAGADISYSGSIAKAPGLKISVLPQDTNGLCGTLDEFSEQLGVDAELVRAILARLGFSRRELIGRTENLSAGQKKKVLIAGSLATPANLYIWDEPLNFVDIISRIQLERLLGANTPTMLLAEHDRYFCENTGTKRLYITKG